MPSVHKLYKDNNPSEVISDKFLNNCCM